MINSEEKLISGGRRGFIREFIFFFGWDNLSKVLTFQSGLWSWGSYQHNKNRKITSSSGIEHADLSLISAIFGLIMPAIDPSSQEALFFLAELQGGKGAQR